jgi:hypothetical protein
MPTAKMARTKIVKQQNGTWQNATTEMVKQWQNAMTEMARTTIKFRPVIKDHHANDYHWPAETDHGCFKIWCQNWLSRFLSIPATKTTRTKCPLVVKEIKKPH